MQYRKEFGIVDGSVLTVVWPFFLRWKHFEKLQKTVKQLRQIHFINCFSA